MQWVNEKEPQINKAIIYKPLHRKLKFE